MRKGILIFSLGLALCLSVGSAQKSASALAPAPDFGRVPLYFIANQGQADAEALFYAKTPAYTLWLTRQGLQFDDARMAFRGARPDSLPAAVEPTDYIVSYFDGRNESDWHTGIPTSRAVLYRDLYPGIDLKVYGTEKAVEYDWAVAPGADPGQIAFGYEGGVSVRLSREGDLVVETGKGRLKHRSPASYQMVDGAKVEVASAFRANGDGTYGFVLGPYDRSRELVIDPLVLVFSSYLGGTTQDGGDGIGVDASGAVYVTGFTDSLDFPPYKASFPRIDAFITKFSPDGTSLVYSAFFPLGFWGYVLAAERRGELTETMDPGLDRRIDGRAALIREGGGTRFFVDAFGAAYLVGTTGNNHFPVKNAFQADYGGGWWDGFFLKLAPSGKSLVFSSYYGGSAEESLTALAVDGSGVVYLAGDTSSSFGPANRPLTKGVIGGGDKLFITKFESNGQTEVYNRIFDLSGWINGISDIAVDSAGAVYAVGITSSLDLPCKKAFQRKLAGWFDAFVLKLSPSGADLDYCSYLGGPNYDFGTAIAVDGAGAAYVTAYTLGKMTVKNAFRKNRRGSIDGFLAKIDPDGKELIYSTYLGGEGMDVPMDIALDAVGRVYIVGQTQSAYFPVKDAYKSVKTGTYDGFLTVFTPSGLSLDFSTYFGGSSSDSISSLALDAEGGIYLTGHTNGKDLPLLNPYQAGYGGGYGDAFVVKFKR